MTNVVINSSGLYSDPNPYSNAPPGALRQANNVMIRREGLLEPRPGFEQFGLQYTGSGNPSVEYKGIVGLYNAPTNDTQNYYLQTNRELLDSNGNPLYYNLQSISQSGEYAGASHAVMYNSLFIPAPSIGGVAKVTNANVIKAGIGRPGNPIVEYDTSTPLGHRSTAVEWLTPGQAVSYRAIFVRKDDDRTVFGPPSGRTVFRNAATSSVSPWVRVGLPDDINEGEWLQLYRSETADAGVEPSDEHDLALEIQIDSTYLSIGYITVLDNVQFENLGASLYTNSTQEGALQENTRPHHCEIVESFNDMLFFARIKEPHTLNLFFNDYFNDIGVFDDTDPTSGSLDVIVDGGLPPTIDNIGQLVTDNGVFPNSNLGNFQAFTWVATVATGSTFQTNKAPRTTGTQFVEVIDWAWYLSDNTPAPYELNYMFLYDAGNRGVSINSGYATALRTLSGISSSNLSLAFGAIAARFQYLDEYTEFIGGDKSLIARRGDTRQSSFKIRLPRHFQNLINNQYTSVLAAGSASVPPGIEYTSEQKEYVNRVMWSKKQQPEHVPFINYVDIGANSEPIIAMKATRRALFVFKTDGVWVIQGDTPETLQVTQVDNNAVLLHPKAISTTGNEVLAWLDSGMCVFTEGGISANVSAPAIENYIRDAQRERLLVEDPASSSELGCFVGYQDLEERFLLGIPYPLSSSADAQGFAADNIYQYDLKTNTWTSWNFKPLNTSLPAYEISCMFDWNGRIMFGGYTNLNDYGELYYERLPSAEAPYSDLTFSSSMTSVMNSSSINNTYVLAINQSEKQFPIGSWITQQLNGVNSGNGKGVVIQTIEGGDSPDSIVVYMFEGYFNNLTSSNPIVSHVPVKQEIEWIAQVNGSPLMTKHWQRGVLTFDTDQRMYEAELSFTSDMVYQSSSVSLQFPFQDNEYPEDIPFVTTRNHARCATLFPKLTIQQGGAKWSLAPLQLDATIGSQKAGRRRRIQRP